MRVLKKLIRKFNKFNKFNRCFSICLYIFGIFFVLLGISSFIVLSSDSESILVYNSNLEKSVDEEELLNSYEKLNEKVLSPVLYNSMSSAALNSKYYPTSFYGKLTHYGPDCKECGGHLGCNGQDARNGNIYYDDKEYGTIRIVAASKTLPCGSIIRINVDAYDPNGMYAIVLDRGVGDGVIDLLKTSEKAKAPSRTVNSVKFDILRYGY